MIIKTIRDEDFTNYKEPCMLIGFPRCSFKCEEECGKKMCQNSSMALSEDIEIDPEKIVKRYMKNSITTSVVFGGLEPFDSWIDVVALVGEFRRHTNDTIVIYTGYNEDEIQPLVDWLKNNSSNIVIKFGRFIPDQQKHFDDVLGIYLASDNQYAERIC